MMGRVVRERDLAVIGHPCAIERHSNGFNSAEAVQASPRRSLILGSGTNVGSQEEGRRKLRIPMQCRHAVQRAGAFS